MSARTWISTTLAISVCAVLTTGCTGFWGKKKAPATTSTTDTVGTTTAGTSTTVAGDTPLAARPNAEGQKPTGAQFEAIHFAYDSAQVADTDRSKVEAVAEFLKSNPNAAVVLEGNCDERGSAEYNLSLGERRALSARAYLLNLGIDAARVQTKSFGKEKPADPGHNEEAWTKNRRVEFVTMQQ